MNPTKYVVVEHAGYTKEQDTVTFPSWQEAYRHVKATYSAAELDQENEDCMHVGIRADFANGESEYQS